MFNDFVSSSTLGIVSKFESESKISNPLENNDLKEFSLTQDLPHNLDIQFLHLNGAVLCKEYQVTTQIQIN